MKAEKKVTGVVHHIAGHIHNPTCGTCGLMNNDDFVYFHHKPTNTYSICINTGKIPLADPDDFAVTEFCAITKKIEVIGLQKPSALYLSYDLCKGDTDTCHDSSTALEKYLPDYLDLSDATDFKIKKGRIETPYPDMGHFYDKNDSYGFVMEDSNDIPKTFFLNDTSIILIKQKPVLYKEVTIPILYTQKGKEQKFDLRLAFGLTQR